jgi:putative membrane protein
MIESGTGQFERKHLHWLGVAREFRPLALGLVYLLLVRQGWTFGDLLDRRRSSYGPAELALVGGLLSYGLLRFLRRTYLLTDESLSMRSGLLLVKQRTLERARIQNVEVRASLVHRLLGVAAVRVSEPSGRSVIELDPVSRHTADMLVTALRGPRADLSTVEAGSATCDDEQVTVDDSRTPTAARIAISWQRIALANIVSGPVLAAVVTLVLALSMRPEFVRYPLVLLFVTLVVAVRRSVRLANFTLTVDDQMLRTTTGPLTTVEQGVRPDQIQSIIVSRSWLRRWIGVESVHFTSAEAGSAEERHLAPAWAMGRWPQLVRVARPDLNLTEESLRPVSPRTVTRYRTRGVVVLASIGVAAMWFPLLWVVAPFWCALGVWWYPRRRYQRYGVRISDGLIISRTGTATERVHLTHATWIEEVRVDQTPGQRRLGLADLRYSGLGRRNSVTVPDLPHEVALGLAEDIVTVAARSAGAGAVVRSEQALRVERLPTQVVQLWRWYGLAAGLAAVLVVVGARVASRLWFGWLPAPPLVLGAALGLALAAVIALLSPEYHRRYGYAISPTHAVIRHGWFWRAQMSVRRDRVHAVETSADPIERHYGLSNLTFRTPGDLGEDLLISHLPVDRAAAVQSEFSTGRAVGATPVVEPERTADTQT